MTQYRPTWVEISKSAFSSNVAHIKKMVGPKVDVCAVLKANGYGHRADWLANLTLQNGAAQIGVSSLEEGLSLRQSGVLAPILILGGIYPFENFITAIQSDLTPTVASFESARYLHKLAVRLNRIVPFHLKVDTGMGRIGVSIDEGQKILKWLQGKTRISLEGVYSHLSSADSNQQFTHKQLTLFRQFTNRVYKEGFADVQCHIANSAGTLAFKESHYEMVRPGLILYGVSPFENKDSDLFQPVLSWYTKVIFLKKCPPKTPISYGRTFITKKWSTIATLPVGYADGIPRLASNKGTVLINGHLCPIVGRVTMDHLMVDVTGHSVSIGDKVVLIGRQGKKALSAQKWAGWAKTNSYEILCRISQRVPRVLVK